MSQLKSKQANTAVELNTYNKILDLSTYSMSVCKPKQRKDNKGVLHDDSHHVPKRYSYIGDSIMNDIAEIGAMVLEANAYYVKANLNEQDRKENYNKRIELQTVAYPKTFHIEHYIRLLNDHEPFADSTIWHTDTLSMRTCDYEER